MVDVLRFQVAIEWKAENFLRNTFSEREVIRCGGRMLAVTLKLTTQRIKIFSCECQSITLVVTVNVNSMILPIFSARLTSNKVIYSQTRNRVFYYFLYA